jgi:hypothetical protein
VPAWHVTERPVHLSIYCHISIVLAVTRIRLDDRGNVCRFPAGVREVAVFEECRPALVPKKNPINEYRGVIFRAKARYGLKLTLLSSTEFKNGISISLSNYLISLL